MGNITSYIVRKVVGSLTEPEYATVCVAPSFELAEIAVNNRNLSDYIIIETTLSVKVVYDTRKEQCGK